MKRYQIYLCGDSIDACPHDSDFDHRFYYGCVPNDFRERTGLSRSRRSVQDPTTKLWRWDGGCDVAALTHDCRCGHPVQRR